MPFEIIRNDITRMKVDAIVCNGNHRLEKSDGVSGAVFEAAGKGLMEECAGLPSCDTGAAIVTRGYDLPAKYIIHTVGPHWHGGQYGEEEILHTCFRNVLDASRKYLCETVAIPMISSGSYGFPKEVVLDIATEEIERFLKKHPTKTVYLVVYSTSAAKLGKKYQKDIHEYITNEEYRSSTDARRTRMYGRNERFIPGSVRDAAGIAAPGFREKLFRYVEVSGRKWSSVYRRAGVGKAVASKIKNNPNYNPSKQTALAFAVSLHLSLYQTEDLLQSFGASFSPASTSDNIVKYFILHGIYSIDRINEALYEYGEPTFQINYV